jgi:hypothetical protein
MRRRDRQLTRHADQCFLCQTAAAAAVIGTTLLSSGAGLAALNKFEEAAGGEFGVGTALQMGSAEAIGEKFDGQVRPVSVRYCSRALFRPRDPRFRTLPECDFF